MIPLVTVTYKTGNYLPATIESNCVQSYPKLEWIAIDGDSFDNTASIINAPLANEGVANVLSKLISKSENLKCLLHGFSTYSLDRWVACRNIIGVVLIGVYEIQLISALGATCIKKPLLFSNVASAKQGFYQATCLVNPFSLVGIQEKLRRFVGLSDLYKFASGRLGNCHHQNIDKTYAFVYARVIVRNASYI